MVMGDDFERRAAVVARPIWAGVLVGLLLAAGLAPAGAHEADGYLAPCEDMACEARAAEFRAAFDAAVRADLDAQRAVADMLTHGGPPVIQDAGRACMWRFIVAAHPSGRADPQPGVPRPDEEDRAALVDTCRELPEPVIDQVGNAAAAMWLMIVWRSTFGVAAPAEAGPLSTPAN